MTGVDAEARCDAAGITLNKNAIPFDPQKPNVASGIRVGTPCVTTQGMGEDEMRVVADLIARAVVDGDADPEHPSRARSGPRCPTSSSASRPTRDRVRRRPEARAPVTDASTRAGADVPLGRLNRRGFRLVMLLDFLAVLGLAVASMLWRYGAPPWPTYPLGAYALSFGVSTVIFITAFYFGGLYEREPRLGERRCCPGWHVSPWPPAASSLLNLALTGLDRQRGSLAQRPAVPHPQPHRGHHPRGDRRRPQPRVRPRAAHPPRGPAAGGAGRRRADSTSPGATSPSSAPTTSSSSPRSTSPTPSSRWPASRATDVLLVTAGWLDEWYPRTIGRLDRLNVTTLLRVTGRETLFGLDRLREVGGLPFVLLLPQTMPTSQRHFKRLLDLSLLLVTAPVWLVLLGGVALYQLAVAGRRCCSRRRGSAPAGSPSRWSSSAPCASTPRPTAWPRTAEGDPRVIPACRWVRATRADELPQILHILAGKMSVVGPRRSAPS